MEITYRQSRTCFPDVEEEQQGKDYVCQGIRPLNEKHNQYGAQCLKEKNIMKLGKYYLK